MTGKFLFYCRDFNLFCLPVLVFIYEWIGWSVIKSFRMTGLSLYSSNIVKEMTARN